MWIGHRSTDKRYPGDNRLIGPERPQRRTGLAPRCRLVASWSWSRFQGLGCSPIKAVRELGLERRETVDMNALSINSAKCWNIRVSDSTRFVTPTLYSGGMTSDNLVGADNQQERLDAYIAGYVDGEGTFHVAVQRNPSTRVGWQLVPEFHVSQNPERRQVIDLIAQRLGCGRIRENHSGSRDRTLVLVVRDRNDLLTKVIPFFEANPLLSSKNADFLTFARIVRAMGEGVHLTEEGFGLLKEQALLMNGQGRYRRVHIRHPESSETICRTP
jgi:LAGLIDADG DNA endonuclease family protein